MGCDYYITKQIVIYFDDVTPIWITLETIEGYYYWSYDEDAEDYEEKVKAYIKRTLTSSMEPIVIYENGSFKKPELETKYKTLIENEIKEIGKQWTEIVRIKKEELRYERE